jgi:hypothetical protein
MRVRACAHVFMGVGGLARAQERVCGRVALFIQHARCYHIVCGLSGSTMFFDIMS